MAENSADSWCSVYSGDWLPAAAVAAEKEELARRSAATADLSDCLDGLSSYAVCRYDELSRAFFRVEESSHEFCRYHELEFRSDKLSRAISRYGALSGAFYCSATVRSISPAFFRDRAISPSPNARSAQRFSFPFENLRFAWLCEAASVGQVASRVSQIRPRRFRPKRFAFLRCTSLAGRRPFCFRTL